MHLTGRREPLEVPPGTPLSTLALLHGLDWPFPCQGRGICGGCRVRMAPAPPASAIERELLPLPLLEEGWRLACLQRLVEDVKITFPDLAATPARLLAGGLLAGGIDPPVRLTAGRTGGWSLRAGRRLIARYPSPPPLLPALAIDVGTTSLSVQLLDLSGPAILGTAVTENPQTAWGDDVLQRIALAAEPIGRRRLRAALMESIRSLLDELWRNQTTAALPLAAVAMAGNPAMTAIFADVDPSPLLGVPPRLPGLPGELTGRDLGLAGVIDEAPVFLASPLAPFVGGDVTAGLLRHRRRFGGGRRVLYLDLGTNGEIVLSANERFLASSAAAGPALEGKRISCGMRAMPGAIESVTFRADLELGVIGGGTPRGMCGSGLLDVLSGLLETGLVTFDGSFISPAEAALHPRTHLAARLAERGGERIFVVSHGSPEVVFTQGDLRELQLARAALRTGIELLLVEAGLGEDDIHSAIIAGTFGFHLRPNTLTRVGIVPPSWRDRLEFVGNASLEGARELLLRRSLQRLGRVYQVTTTSFSLAEHEDFQATFMRNMRFSP